MPTDKRARQKEGRRARLEAERKVQKRRQLLRRSVIIAVVAGVIFATVYAFIPHGSSPPPPKKTPQDKVNAVAVRAGCAEKPATPTNPANTLHFPSPPRMTLNPALRYYATIQTTQGPIKVVLNTKRAPVNVNNFIFLANQGFYHCNTFWRVIPGFMNQGGDPTSSGRGGPGYQVPQDEYPHKVPAGRHQYPDGTVAMANGGPGTNGSQFFIMAGQSVQLPPSYTIIGRVIAGQGAVQRINKQGNPSPQANGSPPAVINRILAVTISSTIIR